METAQRGLPVFRLLVIAGAIFASVSSEFLPTGLLPEMAAELDVTESQVGQLVTVFALTVVLTTAPLAALTRGVSRKWLMVALLGVFACTNVLCAIAPGYEVLMVARVLGGAAQGLFWAVTGPYAARLVAKEQLVRALSVTNAGGTAAFILGVPFATFLGHALGWRMAFAAMAVIVFAFALLVVAFLPPVAHHPAAADGARRARFHRDPSVGPVLVVAGTVFLVALGHNALYTYIAPWSIRVGGVDPEWTGGILLVFGVGGAVGLLLGGIFGDRFPRGAVAVSTGAVVVSMLLLAVAGGSTPAALIGVALWSTAFGAFPALMYARTLRAASPQFRDDAGAWHTVAFNAAIGGGALAGGIVLDAVGIAAIPWFAGAAVAAGLVALLVSDRSRGARPGAADPQLTPEAGLPRAH